MPRQQVCFWDLNTTGRSCASISLTVLDQWLEEKRLVLFDGSDLSKAVISTTSLGTAKPNAFQITVSAEENEVSAP
eukprot:3091615-Amphidinium_carterae.1